MRRFADLLQALGNGIAYIVFAAIVLAVLAFLARWAYDAWWQTEHCTMVLGTRVCR